MHTYNYFVKSFLSEHVRDVRAKKGVSKADMAGCLRIDPRSYADLEKGISCFSAPSLLFYMSSMEKQELVNFMDSFRKAAALLDDYAAV